jgi:hypothetical protein
MSMYTLQLVRWVDDSHCTVYNRCLGVYASLEKAEATKERALRHSRFTDSTRDNFQILGWELTGDAWTNW